MRTLFFKIFLWFWLAMAALIAAIIVTVTTTQNEPIGPGLRDAAANAVTIYAQSAAEIFERGGKAALFSYFERIERETGNQAYLFDAQGAELSGRQADAEFVELARRAQTSDKAEFNFSGFQMAVAKRQTSVDGRRVVLVSRMRRTSMFEPRASMAVRLLRGLAMLLTAGVVCFWLARYLTSPLVKLSRAAKRLAGGDLSARAGLTGARRDEIGDLSRDFDQMAERIESLMTAQRRLLSDISHELRSPLARLCVALELARQKSGPEAATALDRIEREATRLNSMISQLLTLTKLESGAETAQRREVDLAKLVREVAEDAEFEARGKNRTVKVFAADPCAVAGNETLLQSAVENVFRNALRYTPEQKAVEIALRRELNGANGFAIITVRDYGVGVPPEALAKIFQPFYRVADARERQTGGVGLGLSIAERAMRWHGGEAFAANAEGGGLIVTLRLPLLPGAGEPISR